MSKRTPKIDLDKLRASDLLRELGGSQCPHTLSVQCLSDAGHEGALHQNGASTWTSGAGVCRVDGCSRRANGGTIFCTICAGDSTVKAYPKSGPGSGHGWRREPSAPLDLAAVKALCEAATPEEKLTLTRYDHGGGRMYVEGDRNGNGRELVADFFEVGDREFYAAARANVRLLLAEVEWLRAEVAEELEALGISIANNNMLAKAPIAPPADEKEK